MNDMSKRILREALTAVVILVMVNLPLVIPAQAVIFQPFVNYSAGTAPLRMIAADFNGGGPDLAVLKANSSDVSIFLNNGDGTFQPAVNFVTGTAPSDLVTADFNGDGTADLAVANYGSDSVSVLLGDGLGSFGGKIDLTRSPELVKPVAIVAGDFDLDGVADLAVVNEKFGQYDETLSIYHGNGDGTFQYGYGYQLGFVPKAVVTADFNGDGKKDLAFVNSAGTSVLIMLGDGNGNFALTGSFVTGSQPAAIASGDFNGDGKADLAVANEGGDSVSILLGVGDGTFQPKADYPTGAAPRALAVGEYTADGRIDIATANYGANSFSLLRGNGNGTLQTNENFPGAAQPGALVGTDLNADGKPDFVVANNGATSISVFINTTQPAVTSAPTTYDFGSMATDGTTYQYFSLSNSGEALLDVAAIDTSGSDAALFSVTSGGANPCPTLPTTLPYGGSCTVMITFAPTTLGAKSANLRVTFNGSTSPATAALSGTGTDTPFHTLTLTIGGTGMGTVSVKPSLASPVVPCLGAGCSQSISSGNIVTIPWTTAADSVVAWTGCDGASSCLKFSSYLSLMMNTAKSITATFTHVEPARVIGGSDYAILQAAYAGAADGSTINTRAVFFNENLLFNSNISVSLQGGYGGAATLYDAVIGVTTLSGSLTIADGSVALAGFVITP